MTFFVFFFFSSRMVTLTIFLNTWTVNSQHWLFTVHVFRLFLLIFSLSLSPSPIPLRPPLSLFVPHLTMEATVWALIFHGSTMGDVRWMGRRQWSWRWIPSGPARSSTRLEILVVLCLFFFYGSAVPFFPVDRSWSVLIGGSVALAVGGSTSCVRWLNGADPVVEWCGIEVLLWCGRCFFFVVVQWVGDGGDQRVREKWKQKLKKMIKKIIFLKSREWTVGEKIG